MGSGKNRPPKRNANITLGNRVLPGSQVEKLKLNIQDLLDAGFITGSSGSPWQESSGEVTLVNTGSLVGIGTTSPPHKLSVFHDEDAAHTTIGIDNIDQRLLLTAYYELGVHQYSKIQSTNNAESVSNDLVLNPDGGSVGIGLTNPVTNLHLEGTNVTIRLRDSANASDSYSDISDRSDAQFQILKQATAGSAPIIDIDPSPLDGTSSTSVRLFRSTNTTGIKRVQLLKGDLSANVDTQFGVDGTDTYILSGNFGVGTASPFLGVEDYGHANRPYSSPSVGVVTGSVATASGSWLFMHCNTAGLFTYTDAAPALIFNDSSKFTIGWNDHAFGDVDGSFTKFLELNPVTKAGARSDTTSGSLAIGQNMSGSSQYESTLQVNGSIVLGDAKAWVNTMPGQPFDNFNGERLMILDGNGAYILATQDGAGRVNETWNSARVDSSYRYITAGEEAYRRNWQNGDFLCYTATTGSAVGDTISWNRHFAVVGGTDANPRVEIDQYYTSAEQPRMCVIRNTNSSSTAQFIVFAAATVSSNITTENITLNSPAAGRYTVGKTGTYFLNCTLYLISSGIDTACRLSVFLNGVESHFVIAAINSSVDPVERTLSIMMDLTAGNIVDIRADSGGGLTTTAQAGCVLSMWMVA